MINKITSLIDEGLVVEISGRIVKSDGNTNKEYNTVFYTSAQFELYLSKLQDINDIGRMEVYRDYKDSRDKYKF